MSDNNAPHVVEVLFMMPFIGAAFLILFGIGVDKTLNFIEKRREDNAQN